jgi:hypothetical protein
MTLAIKVYRKPTHIDQYLNFLSNHPPYAKVDLIQSHHKGASTMRQDCQDLNNEINSL